MRLFKNRFWSLAVFLSLLLLLPVLVNLVKTAQHYLGQAVGQPANIVVDTQTSLGPLPRIWEGLAQGGEESNPQSLKPVIPQVSALKPKYIRIDHVFDFYEVIGGQNKGRMTYNFSKLDQAVENILLMGVKPMLSLSYMPSVISSGDVTAPPSFWSDWQEVAKETIQHYSGKNEKNLTDVYYEVWNEPDLFGGWKIGQNPDYRLLYKYAVLGANETQNTNPFKIGGPGTTGAYRAWLDKFLEFVTSEKLRLDFFSWHRYNIDPEKFVEDVNYIDDWLTKHGGFYLLPKFLTEWGPESENSPHYDNNFAATHLLATVRKLLGRADLVFTFEIKDGPSPPTGDGEKYWGRWGILTNEKFGVTPKPRYKALEFLSRLSGDRLEISGEGTWVSAVATKFVFSEDVKIQLILTNFDPAETHNENVPVTISGLDSGTYRWTQNFLEGTVNNFQETATSGSISRTVFLPANSAVIIEVSKI